MKTIHKYPLSISEQQYITLPIGAEIIRVEAVDGLPYLWAVIEDTAHTIPTSIHMYKTGQEITPDLCNMFYIGCVKIFVGQELCLYLFQNLNT